MAKAPVTGDPISLEELNRATLARQFLLERTDLDVAAVVHHLVGLQAQTPHTWYTGLHSRVRDFDPAAASALLRERSLVRIVVMRSTIHLLTVADAYGLRPLVQPVLDRGLKSGFGAKLAAVDQDRVLKESRELLAPGEPLTFKQIGTALSGIWPGTDAHALSMVARHRLDLVQVPPRGLWRTSGPVAHLPLQDWARGPASSGALDAPDTEGFTAQEMVRRYLTAFGPATVADVQAWSGLTRLATVLASMSDELLPLAGPNNEQLWDLPDAPRPGADVEAPARLLYDYDNLLLSHRDRSRFITDEYAARNFAQQSTTPCLVLVGGRTSATWRLREDGPHVTMEITPLRPLQARERSQIRAEGTDLGVFLTDGGDVEVAFLA